jgi:hypothetical protein
VTDFQRVTVDDVISTVHRLPDKNGARGVLPTAQLKLVADLIAPFLYELFNRSLETATVPEVLKSAYITRLLEKTDLDSNDMWSYRPISNLLVISRLLERIVHRYFLSRADVLSRLQSAYRDITRRRRPYSRC